MASVITSNTGSGLALQPDASGQLQFSTGYGGTQLTLANNVLTMGSTVNVAMGANSVMTMGDGSQYVTVSSFGMRNRIINGAMAVAQRGTAISIANSSFAYGATDRWSYNNSTGATITSSQVFDSTQAYGSPYYTSLTVASCATSGFLDFSQRIENLNISDLAGKTVTLTFTASFTATGGTWSGLIYIGYPNTNPNDYSSITYLTPVSFTPTGTPTKFTLTLSLPSGVYNGLTIGPIRMTNSGSSSTSITFAFSSVQLEVGSVATPFERRQYGTELALCQRYCYACTNRPLGITLNGNALYSGIVSYPVTMRTSPALSNASCSVSGGSVGTPALQTSSGQASTLDAGIIWNTANNWNTNAAIAITAIFSAEL